MEIEVDLVVVEENDDGKGLWDCVCEETETAEEGIFGGKHHLDHAWKVTESV